MPKLQEKPFSFFISKTAIYLCPSYGTGEAFSPKREHPALHKMKFINFFLCLWEFFALLDPDPDPDPGT